MNLSKVAGVVLAMVIGLGGAFSGSAGPSAVISHPTAGGAGLALVQNGQHPLPIVVFKDAPPKTRRAADELAEYIEKISGAQPKVIEGRPDPLPAQAIWVGMQPVLTEVFPGLDLEFRHPEEILIAANENHLVIAGRDRWDPDHMRLEGDSL